MLVIPHTHTNITTDLQHSNLPHASTAEPATMHPHEMQVVQASRLSRCEHSLGRHLHTAPELSLGLSRCEHCFKCAVQWIFWIGMNSEIKKPCCFRHFWTTSSVPSDAATSKEVRKRNRIECSLFKTCGTSLAFGYIEMWISCLCHITRSLLLCLYMSSSSRRS